MPHELQRITTTYVDVEDRLRLTGVLANGTVVQLWLTQRLLGRLVPPLTSWLERNALLVAEHALPGAAPAAKVALADQEMVQGFAQQSAWAQLKPQPPVHAASDSATWVVTNVQLSLGPQTVLLTLKNHTPTQPTVALNLNAQLLRQWLGIVFDQVLLAQWPTACWPAWMHDGQPGPTPEGNRGQTTVLIFIHQKNPPHQAEAFFEGDPVFQESPAAPDAAQLAQQTADCPRQSYHLSHSESDRPSLAPIHNETIPDKLPGGHLHLGPRLDKPHAAAPAHSPRPAHWRDNLTNDSPPDAPPCRPEQD